ncbi:MAG: hypothetical protein RJA09_341 [Pseudomonadota bacterium]
MVKQCESIRHAVRSPLLESLFPSAIVACELTALGSTHQLLPDERATLGAAVPKRVAEFAAGRQCAHEAMRELGVPDHVPLLRGPHREPVWPSGLLGSLTHTEGYCAAVVGRCTDCAGLGIDAERLGSVETDLWPHVFVEAETAALRALDATDRATLSTVLFSAKEAFFKSQFQLSALTPEFTAVALRPVGPVGIQGTLEVTWVADGRLTAIANQVVLRYALHGPWAVVGATIPAVVSTPDARL